MYQIPLPSSRTYHILNKYITKNSIKATFMIAISEKEEAEIDNIDKNTIQFHRGNKTFNVTKKDIYCYGEIDFDDESTLNQINDFTFLNYLDEVGVPIPSNYDYKTHSCTSPKRNYLWAESWDTLELTKMAHGYLGKPQRILLFNQNIK